MGLGRGGWGGGEGGLQCALIMHAPQRRQDQARSKRPIQSNRHTGRAAIKRRKLDATCNTKIGTPTTDKWGVLARDATFVASASGTS